MSSERFEVSLQTVLVIIPPSAPAYIYRMKYQLSLELDPVQLETSCKYNNSKDCELDCTHKITEKHLFSFGNMFSNPGKIPNIAHVC